MYHAKALGRGRAEHFTDVLAAEIAERAQLESDLRDAVDKDEFELVYQPQVSATDGRIVAAEALLRWRHPDGLKMPGAFIQRAEETGLIVEIGEWVVGTVAETISRWGKLGIEQRLAVNISPRQLDHASFFRRLREAMLAANAPAKLLELEITETLAMHCSVEVVDAIAMLRADGASIAIDDFGTGYSNLSRLRDLPVDRVKLDRSLIEHVAEFRRGADDRPGGDRPRPRAQLRSGRRGDRERGPGRGAPRDRLRRAPGLCHRPADARGRVPRMGARRGARTGGGVNR